MRPRTIRSSLALVFAGVLSACGEPEKPAPPTTGGPMKVEAPAPPLQAAKAFTPEERTRVRLTAFFDVVRAQVPSAAAPFIVYRGDDPARRWKDVSNYAAEDEKKRVDDLFTEAWNHLVLGTPRFLTFRSEKQSEGTWLVWEIAFGEGDGAKRAAYACLEVKGTIELGDID